MCHHIPLPAYGLDSYVQGLPLLRQIPKLLGQRGGGEGKLLKDIHETSGVSQGSIQDPVLCMYFVNGMPGAVKCLLVG